VPLFLLDFSRSVIYGSVMTENPVVVVTARVESGLHREVRQIAVARGESLQSVLVKALESYVAAFGAKS
jgi:hypothetical protein